MWWIWDFVWVWRGHQRECWRGLVISHEKSSKNLMFLRFFFFFFFSEKWIFANFHLYFQCIQKCILANFHLHFQCIQISESALTLWRHRDVVWISMVLILISMDRESPYLYAGSKYRVSGVPYRKSREGVQQPSFEGRVTKNTSGGLGLMKLPVVQCQIF